MKYPGSRPWREEVKAIEAALILDRSSGHLAELVSNVIKRELAEGCDYWDVNTFWQEIWAELVFKNKLQEEEAKAEKE
jgi:hypothetical protein